MILRTLALSLCQFMWHTFFYSLCQKMAHNYLDLSSPVHLRRGRNLKENVKLSLLQIIAAVREILAFCIYLAYVSKNLYLFLELGAMKSLHIKWDIGSKPFPSHQSFIEHPNQNLHNLNDDHPNKSAREQSREGERDNT